MEIFDAYFIFLIDNQRFALRLSKVERVVSMVEIIKLPKSPEFLLGAINFHGDFLPIINLRKQFLLPNKEVDINDKLIIIEAEERKVAIHADLIEGIAESKEIEIIDKGNSFTNDENVNVIFKYKDNIIFCYDIDKFLRTNKESFLKSNLEKQVDREIKKAPTK